MSLSEDLARARQMQDGLRDFSNNKLSSELRDEEIQSLHSELGVLSKSNVKVISKDKESL